MRFASQGTQCNLITRAKIINTYQDEIRAVILETLEKESYKARRQGEKKVEASMKQIVKDKEKQIVELQRREATIIEREKKIKSELMQERKMNN